MQVRSIFMRLSGDFISNINQRMAIYSAENVALAVANRLANINRMVAKPAKRASLRAP